MIFISRTLEGAFEDTMHHTSFCNEKLNTVLPLKSAFVGYHFPRFQAPSDHLCHHKKISFPVQNRWFTAPPVYTCALRLFVVVCRSDDISRAPFLYLCRFLMIRICLATLLPIYLHVDLIISISMFASPCAQVLRRV